MWFPNPFSKKERRVTKAGNTDSLDRPDFSKGYASILKQDEPKYVQKTNKVSPHCPVAHSIRMRGIQG